MAINGDGTRIVSGSQDKTIKAVGRALTGKQLLTLKGHALPVANVAISSDGTRIVSESHNPFNSGSPSELKVWDTQTATELLTLKSRNGMVSSVAINGDGTRIVSTRMDNTVIVWEARTGK